MFPQTDYILSPKPVQGLMSQGLDGMPALIRIQPDSALQMEREKYLQAGSYQRSEDRKEDANGFNPKMVNPSRISSTRVK